VLQIIKNWTWQYKEKNVSLLYLQIVPFLMWINNNDTYIAPDQ